MTDKTNVYQGAKKKKRQFYIRICLIALVNENNESPIERDLSRREPGVGYIAASSVVF